MEGRAGQIRRDLTEGGTQFDLHSFGTGGGAGLPPGIGGAPEVSVDGTKEY